MTERLEIWETAFSEREFPSVSFRQANSTSDYLVKVANEYELRISGVVSIRCTEEAFFPLDRFNILPREGTSCCYLWKNSSWIRDFDESSKQAITQAFNVNILVHYVILGGDNILEFLAVRLPEVVRV